MKKDSCSFLFNNMLGRTVPVMLFLLFMTGCGYTTGSLLPTHIRTVHIKPFRNRINLTEETSADLYRFRTYQAQLEIDITKEVIDQFISDGYLKVVEEENADAIVSGELIDFLRQPIRYGDDNETVDEFRISIVCSIEFRDVRKNKLMWREPRIIGDSTYIVSGAHATSESSAITSAVSDLARRIVNRSIEGW
jgi:hypothetical protein